MKLADVRKRAIDDPLFMGRACIPRTFDKPAPEMHREMVDLFTDPTIHRGNVIAPRNHAKTTVMGVLNTLDRFFAYDERMGRRKQPHFVLLTSLTRPHSINTLTTIKNILEFNPHFRAVFGYHGAQNAKSWREDMVQLDTGDIIVCRGAGQQVRGLNINGMRPDVIIPDDIEGEENTKTPEAIEAVTRWFLQALTEATSADGYVYNIGTPQVQRSLVYTLESMATWKTLRYKAIVTGEDGQELALWPEQFSLEALREKRSALEGIGKVSAFYREYQCEIIGDEDQLFKDEYLRRWEGELKRDVLGNAYLERPFLPPLPVNVFMGVDPASTLSATSDYTSIMVVAMDAEKNFYVIESIRRRMKPMEVAQAVVDAYERYRPLKTQIETVGYQSMIAEYIRKDRGLYIAGLEIRNNPRRGKAERLEGLQPMFARGRVHLRTQSGEWAFGMSDFRDELLLFPRARHDDTLDGFYYAVKGAFPPYHDVITNHPSRLVERVREYDWILE